MGGAPAQANEVRHASQVRPKQPDYGAEERITTKRVDLRELARLSASLSEPTPAMPMRVLQPSGVPRLRVSRESLFHAQLDRNEAFIVSLLDDVSTVAMVVDVAGMAEHLTLATLVRLCERGIVDVV